MFSILYLYLCFGICCLYFGIAIYIFDFVLVFDTSRAPYKWHMALSTMASG